MSQFVFWDIHNITDVVLKINGVAISPTYPAQDMKSYNTSYAVVLDNTGAEVLTYTGTTSPTLDFGTYQVIGQSFTGSRPERKPH